MSLLEEAYLPIGTINSLNNKLTYLKEIYDECDLENTIEVCEEFDPEILKNECQKYKIQMEKILFNINDYKKKILNITESLDTLNSVSTQLHSLQNESTAKITENIKNIIGTYETDLSNAKQQFKESVHKYKYLFSISPYYVKNDPRHICPICTTNEVNTAYVPCGHTICTTCSIKCDIDHCYICRGNIEKVIKLYYI